ncbi:MAG: hypothetical protein ACREOU_10150 [Candidatus Eiseniibacteriota bacterium]
MENFDGLELAPDSSETQPHAVKPEANYYCVVIDATDIRGKSELIRLVWHKPMGRAFIMSVPGLRPRGSKRLYELYLSLASNAQFTSRYLTTREQDPLLADLVTFASKLDPASYPKHPDMAVIPDAGLGSAVLFEVPVVESRATIDIENLVTVPLDVNDERKKLQEALSRLGNTQAYFSGCGRRYVEATRLGIDTVSVEGQPAEYWRRVKGARDQVRSSFFPPPAKCAKDEWPTMLTLDSRIDDLLAQPRSRVIEGKYKITNRPLRRWGFGVIAGVVLDSWGQDLAKLEQGNQVPNPVSGAVPMAAVNFHPWAYDPETPSPLFAERFRLFVAGAVAPSFGIATGAGYAVVRGWTLNAGVGALRVDQLKSGESYGAPPSDNNHPFKKATATFVFFGFGYNIK